MLPHTGQGAAQALEDAVALGLALGAGGDHAEALRRYERVRSARTARLVKLGRRVVRVTTTRNQAVIWLRNTSMRVAPMKALLRAFYLSAEEDPHRALRTRRRSRGRQAREGVGDLPLVHHQPPWLRSHTCVERIDVSSPYSSD